MQVRQVSKPGVIAWLVAILGLVSYELWAVFNSTQGDLLSEVVWKYGQHPMITLVVGVLVGHFWWPKKTGGKQ